ncbi:MAG: RagB/SusD family nutrient uptake outer membrane protein [Nonlabens sp.]
MKKILLLLCFATAFSSCEDFLDVEPDLQISFAEQLGTEEGVREIVSGIYFSFNSVIRSRYFIYGDALAGNVDFTPSTSNNEIAVSNLLETSYGFNETPDDSDFAATYDDLYEVINQCNLVLQNIDGMEFLNSPSKAQLRAEMLTLRAVSHYQVYLLYAQNINFTADGSHLGIVYNTSTLTPGEDFPARKTAQESYILMQQDLEEALSSFTAASFLQAGPEFSYFNETTTTAIYARIALQMNDWQKALDLSEEIINNSGLALTSQSAYVDQWQTADQLSETIMQLTAPFDIEEDGSITVGFSVSSYFQYSSESNYGDIAASEDLLDLFDNTDIRNNLYTTRTLPTRIMGSIVDLDYTFIEKYQEESSITFIRLSEIYLINAEAQERLSPGSPAAIARLNEIRNRAGLNDLNPSADILEEVFIERRREMAFENFLFFDLKRYGKDVERNDGCIANLCDLSYPSPFFILPIPRQSITINENMIQNEGY